MTKKTIARVKLIFIIHTVSLICDINVENKINRYHCLIFSFKRCIIIMTRIEIKIPKRQKQSKIRFTEII